MLRLLAFMARFKERRVLTALRVASDEARGFDRGLAQNLLAIAGVAHLGSLPQQPQKIRKTMSEEINLVAVVRAKAGHEQEVARILEAMIAPSRAEPGCQLYTLYRDQAMPNHFVFIERWTDRAALTLHEQTEHFRRMSQQLPPLVEGESELRLLDLIA